MKIFLKIGLKIILSIAALLLMLSAILYLVYNEPLPKGTNPKKADALAEKMLKALNAEGYKQTNFLEWSFANGAHKYKWDKASGKVSVEWSNYKVTLNLAKPTTSQVFQNSQEIIGDSKAGLIKKATDYFNNDSFWLVAPFKVFDKGTTRSIVTFEDGLAGLLVTYSSGGTTPGDSYLWKLNENGFPNSYQMWVKIIPIGGLEASWDDWKVMENGIFLPASHQLGPITLSMGAVKAYN